MSMNRSTTDAFPSFHHFPHVANTMEPDTQQTIPLKSEWLLPGYTYHFRVQSVTEHGETSHDTVQAGEYTS